jgi:hypothetical protein
MGVPKQSVSLYSKLKDQFERNEEDYLQLQKEWEGWKSIGYSEDDIMEMKCIDDYEHHKDSIRSICSIIDDHLVDFTFKETSPY